VRYFHTKDAVAAAYEDDVRDQSGLTHHDRQVLDPHPLIIKIGNISEPYVHHKSSLYAYQFDMSLVTRRPLSTRGSNVTGTSSLRNLPRPRSSMFRFRSTPEPSHGDDMELQQLLPPASTNVSEEPDGRTGIDNTWVSETLTTPPYDLQRTISGFQASDTENWAATENAWTEPPPCRKVIKALETLIRDIDQQHHVPPQWSHIRPWLLSATQHTPCARPDTTSTKTSLTQLEVPPAVRRYLAASRHESWEG